MISDFIIDELAVRYSITEDESALNELLSILTPIIRATARKYSFHVPTTTADEFEALFREDVWEACRKGTLSNFDPSRGHVMPRIYTYWRYTMYGEIRKAQQRRRAVSLDALTLCPARLVVQLEDMVEISQALQRFRLYRPMDYAIIAALMDGVDKEQLAVRLGRREYDAYTRQRVCRARKAFGKVLCG